MDQNETKVTKKNFAKFIKDNGLDEAINTVKSNQNYLSTTLKMPW